MYNRCNLEELILIRQHMLVSPPGWQEQLALELGKPVNAVYCASYRLMDAHTNHRRWTWTDKLKVVELRERRKMYFKDIALAMGCKIDQARRIYRYMTGKGKIE